LNEIAWHRASATLHQDTGPVPAPLEKLSALRSTPDAIGRLSRASSADRDERVRAAPCAALPDEAKGLAITA